MGDRTLSSALVPPPFFAAELVVVMVLVTVFTEPVVLLPLESKVEPSAFMYRCTRVWAFEAIVL